MESIEMCASACRGESQMFTFGLNTPSNSRCNPDGKCACYCEVDTADFKCKTQEVHTGYDLYAFTQGMRQTISNSEYSGRVNIRGTRKILDDL